MDERDATVILGNGLREDGLLPSWVRSKLDRAIELFRGEYLIPSSAGTAHRPPPLDARGFPIFESVAAARYLMERGIPADRILTETSSYDTIGNAFFTRVVHAEPRRMTHLLVIVSDFHRPRAEAVFRWVYGLEPRAVAFDLRFEAVGDPAMDPAMLHARSERERQRLRDVTELIPRIVSFPDLHRWLFTEHEAYDAVRGAFAVTRVDGPTLESY